MSRVGVLVMSYGTPSGPGDIERYYTDIRGGRPPSPETLAELRERYRAIGNTFPLTAIAREQTNALRADLDHSPGTRFEVSLGLKHSPPFIADAVRALVESGVAEVVGIVLAPHYAGLSVGDYEKRAGAALQNKVPFTMIRYWYDHPSFLEVLCGRVGRALDALEPEDRGIANVVFTAHSLPARILESADPYPGQLQHTAELVAGCLGLERFTTAWQSAGHTPEPWLGPDLNDVIADLASLGRRAIVVCPCGFASDHLEVLWDIDIEACATAARVGARLVRTESMNADPAFVAALASIVRERWHGHHY